MAQKRASPRGRRRASAALSRDIVVEAALELLDERGERGFTFPLLTARLQTGNGAIYWHVGSKDELVALAADRAIGEALAEDGGRARSARGAIDRLRTLALGVFDALDRHPWAAAHVTAGVLMPSALGVMERIGSLLDAAGVVPERGFVTATAIFNYVVGVSSRITGVAVTVGETTSRDDFLAESAERWARLDPAEYPFLVRSTGDLRDHDDREQFEVGLDLLLGGLSVVVDSGGR